MKASNLIKILVASALLSSPFLSSSASANNGYVSVSFGDFDGNRMQYRHVDRVGHDRYPQYGARAGNYIDRIQSEQRDRIQQGIRSGELTQHEAARLIDEQREIDRLQHVYLTDYRLTSHERQRLLAELDEASRNIWRQKHDAQDRNDFRPPWFMHR